MKGTKQDVPIREGRVNFLIMAILDSQDFEPLVLFVQVHNPLELINEGRGIE